MNPKFLMVTAAITLPQPASAQEVDRNRFSLEKTEHGFVRLDSRSGALSLCQEKDGNLVCRMAADERAAYKQELDLLGKRVAVLEGKAGLAPPVSKTLPDDAEVERSLSIMESFMRRFFGLVQEFDADKPVPDRS
jgi:hypothetical protein